MTLETIDHMILPVGMTHRPATPADHATIAAIYIRSARRFDDTATTTAHDIAEEWTDPDFDPARDTRVIVHEGRVIAYVELWAAAPWVSGHAWYCIEPQFDDQGLEPQMLAWAESLFQQRTLEAAPAGTQIALGCHTHADNSHQQRIYQQAGYAHTRTFQRMMIDLDPPPPPVSPPEGITFRTMNYTDETDVRRAFKADIDAFRDHFGYVERDFEDRFARFSAYLEKSRKFDPDLFWVAEAPNGEIAGVSFNWPSFQEDDSIGWIGSLGVIPAYRKRGIATALLKHSFHHFYTLGKKQVGLGVDAASITGATRLYKRVGMRVTMNHYHFEKVIRPGEELRRI